MWCWHTLAKLSQFSTQLSLPPLYNQPQSKRRENWTSCSPSAQPLCSKSLYLLSAQCLQAPTPKARTSDSLPDFGKPAWHWPLVKSYVSSGTLSCPKHKKYGWINHGKTVKMSKSWHKEGKIHSWHKAPKNCKSTVNRRGLLTIQGF